MNIEYNNMKYLNIALKYFNIKFRLYNMRV